MKPMIYSLSLAIAIGGIAFGQSQIENETAAEASGEAAVEAQTETEASAEAQADVDSQVEAAANDAAESVEEASEEIQQYTREEVRDAQNQAAEEVNEAQQEVSDEVNEVEENVNQEIDEAQNDVREGVDEAQQNAEQAVEEFQEDVSDTQREVTEEIDEVQRNTRNPIEDAEDETRQELNEASEELNDTVESATDEIPEPQTASGDAEVEATTQTQQQLNSDSSLGLNQRQGINANGNINQLGMFLNDAASNAVVIDRVAPNSPAARLGLRRGDRIVRFNNRTYSNRAAFLDSLRNWTPSGSVPVTYWRDGREYTTTMDTTWDADRPYSTSPNTDGEIAPAPYEANRPNYDESYSDSSPIPAVPYSSPAASQPIYGSTYQAPCVNAYDGWNSRRAMRQARRAARRNDCCW